VMQPRCQHSAIYRVPQHELARRFCVLEPKDAALNC